MTETPLRVTFDTNVANLIADPVEYAGLASAGTGEQLQAAINSGKIRAFISEASVFVECLGFPEKLAYLAVAGTTKPRPAPDPRRVAIFKSLGGLGVEMLHAPLIGAEIFIETMPWAKDEVHSAEERHRLFCDFGRQYPCHEPLERLGNKKLQNQPVVPTPRPTSLAQDWAVALKREWDEGDEAAQKALRKEAEPLISEWCDVLIVGSHVAYGNDAFCTVDEGKGAGSGSLLHHLNRGALAAKGIRIVRPETLV
jgi:hypothetical protein